MNVSKQDNLKYDYVFLFIVSLDTMWPAFELSMQHLLFGSVSVPSRLVSFFLYFNFKFRFKGLSSEISMVIFWARDTTLSVDLLYALDKSRTKYMRSKDNGRTFIAVSNNEFDSTLDDASTQSRYIYYQYVNLPLTSVLSASAGPSWTRESKLENPKSQLDTCNLLIYSIF